MLQLYADVCCHQLAYKNTKTCSFSDEEDAETVSVVDPAKACLDTETTRGAMRLLCAIAEIASRGVFGVS